MGRASFEAKVDVSVHQESHNAQADDLSAASLSERIHIKNLRRVRQTVTNVLAEVPTIDEAVTAVLHAVCDGLHWDIGFFWVVDRETNALRCQQSWHREGLPLVEFEARSREQTFAYDRGLPGRVWASGGSTWVREVRHEADFPRAQWATHEGLHSAFAVPIIVSQRCLGVFEFFNQQIRKPDEDLLEMMATVAGQVGQYLERKRAEAGLREQTLVAETLNRVGHLLAAELDLESIVQIVIEEGLHVTGSEAGVFFYEVENEREEPSFEAARAGTAAEPLTRFLQDPRNAELIHSTLQSSSVVRLEDATAAPHPLVRSYLAVPVISRRGGAVGSLFLCHSRPGMFAERHERILAGIATQAATAIDNARLYKRTQESEQRFRQLAEQIDDVFWMLDPHAPRMLYISPAYESISGRSRERLYADPRFFLEAVHPDDQARFLANQQRYIRGEQSSLEYRLVRPDGTIRWMWDRAFPIEDESGKIYRVAGITEDATQRKQSEDAIRFLADASTSLAAIVDYESTLQRVAGLAVPAFADWCAVDLIDADGALRRLAVVHADPAKVRLASELTRRFPLDPEAPRGGYSVLRSGQSEWIADLAAPEWIEAARHDPHLRLLRRLGLGSVMCVPLQIRNTTTGVLSFAYAESKRHYEPHDLALAEELGRRAAVAIENARLYAALREADRRKDEFLAMLAHELRNPLAPIRSGLDILAMQELPQSETVHLMQEQVGHLVRLVDDLLDVSRIIRGRIELRREPVELATIIKRSVDALGPTLASRQQELVVRLHDEPLWLDADPVRLVQVVENLLNNASKYMDRGGQILLTTTHRDGRALVEVQDEGIGIEPDLLPNIFDLFTQSARSLDRAQGGLGIGLTLVRNLVEMHQGKVSVASEGPGRGSRFEVSLPTIEAKQIPQETTEAPLQSQGRRILVVDDNVGAAKMLAALLKRLGPHEIAMAHDGPSTLTVAEQFDPELILLDIGLPKMDGLTVAWNLRQQPQFEHTLLAALTGYGQEEDRRRSKEAGFDEHLVKPVSIQTLRKLLSHPKLAKT
ncbi:GAF domain-containing protein [Candidatus Laterigemmans baculatus]|uniref:GAF domain-containing protein n=1 Tax=Candidatus Laterigemmans baculatus TaxID=2770505 RepID=UPI0013DBC5E4|nr:GAF domain-containing protein [Candidatus Laterigemmans baculatus]